MASYESGFIWEWLHESHASLVALLVPFFTFRSSFGVLHVHTNFEVGAFAIRRSTRKRPSIDARCSMKRVKAVDLAIDLGIRERCRLTETFARLSEPNTMCKLWMVLGRGANGGLVWTNLNDSVSGLDAWYFLVLSPDTLNSTDECHFKTKFDCRIDGRHSDANRRQAHPGISNICASEFKIGTIGERDGHKAFLLPKGFCLCWQLESRTLLKACWNLSFELCWTWLQSVPHPLIVTLLLLLSLIPPVVIWENFVDWK